VPATVAAVPIAVMVSMPMTATSGGAGQYWTPARRATVEMAMVLKEGILID